MWFTHDTTTKHKYHTRSKSRQHYTKQIMHANQLSRYAAKKIQGTPQDNTKSAGMVTT